MSDSSSPKKRPKRSGWRQLKRENQQGFKSNFAPLRMAVRRSELFGSMVELFVSAIVGVSKWNLGARSDKDDATGKEFKA